MALLKQIVFTSGISKEFLKMLIPLNLCISNLRTGLRINARIRICTVPCIKIRVPFFINRVLNLWPTTCRILCPLHLRFVTINNFWYKWQNVVILVGVHTNLHASSYLSELRLWLLWANKKAFPVGCILPAWKPYVLHFQWPPPDVILWVPKWMNKFEKVSNDYHKMSLVCGSISLMSRGEEYPIWTLGCGGTLLCDLFHDALDVTYPLTLWTDKYLWKHYVSVTLFAGGNKIKMMTFMSKSHFHTLID